MKKLASMFLSAFLIMTMLILNLGVSAEKADVSPHTPKAEKSIPNPDQTEKTGDAAIEIERKFLIDAKNLPQDKMKAGKVYKIEQTYINFSPEIRVRKLNNNGVDYYYFNVKRPNDDIGLSREETQFRITKSEYDTLLKKKSGETIYKTRYQFMDGDVFVFVDIYSGNLKGLVVAEVEFDSVKASESFEALDWFGKDITADLRYKNGNLAKDGMPQDK